MQITIVRHMRYTVAILSALSVGSLFAQTSLIEQGRGAISRGDADAAVDMLEKAVTQSPNSPEAHFYLANAYSTKGQNGGIFGAAGYIPKAKSEFEKAVALNPKYVEARFGLVQFYVYAPGMMGGSYDKAFDQAREIKAIDPFFGHRAYAFIYTQQQNTDLAKKELVDAIGEQPKSPKAHSYYGLFLVNTEKNYAAAFAEFETALKLDSTYMPAVYHLGRTAAKANTDYARGEEALKKYLAYIPRENEPTLANAHYFLGLIYENEGKKVEAKQKYEQALVLNPSLKEASEALKRVQ